MRLLPHLENYIAARSPRVLVALALVRHLRPFLPPALYRQVQNLCLVHKPALRRAYPLSRYLYHLFRPREQLLERAVQRVVRRRRFLGTPAAVRVLVHFSRNAVLNEEARGEPAVLEGAEEARKGLEVLGTPAFAEKLREKVGAFEAIAGNTAGTGFEAFLAVLVVY